MRNFFRGQSLAAAVLLAAGLAAAVPISTGAMEAIANQVAETAPPSSFEIFLDRLMGAESGGRSHAKNPRSTALGPFQFINGTFLQVTRRHFPTDIAGLTEKQILQLRTDRDFSRRAATAFSKDNIGFLAKQGLEPTFAHLRLAFLLGASDAAQIVLAQQDTRVVNVLSAAVVKANPFMRGMSAADLLAKSERDLTRDRTALVPAAPEPNLRPAPHARPSMTRQTRHAGSARDASCNRKLASCQKFIALHGKTRRAAGKT